MNIFTTSQAQEHLQNAFIRCNEIHDDLLMRHVSPGIIEKFVDLLLQVDFNDWEGDWIDEEFCYDEILNDAVKVVVEALNRSADATFERIVEEAFFTDMFYDG